jgi:hypothetical protein
MDAGCLRVYGSHMTPVAAETAAFDRLSWHDNAVHGLRIDVGDPDRGQWHSRLILDIDNIVEWLCGTDGRTQFRVAPATLAFENATDLSIQLPERGYGTQISLNPLSIDRIEREGVTDQRICLDRPYWRWSIRFNDPEGGLIAFGASGFRLALRAEPLLTAEQRYPTDRSRPLPF